MHGPLQGELMAKKITIPDPFTSKDLSLDPKTAGTITVKPNCDQPSSTPTICDPKLRSCNTQADCGGPLDIYHFSPWRAPGAAPVIDSCGSAGGRFRGQGIGGAGASFQNSTLSRQGDLGSALPKGPASAKWTRGSSSNPSPDSSFFGGGGG